MSIQIVNAKQSPQRKQTLTAIALTLILATSIFIVSIPFSRAENIDTYAFISVAPNPVGVNQQVNVLMWLSNVPPTASGAQGDRWENFTVTVTKPDGTTQILGPYRSDSSRIMLHHLYTRRIRNLHFSNALPRPINSRNCTVCRSNK